MMDVIHAFMESYQNGFYVMQTPLETIAAFVGNASYMIIHLGGLLK